MAQPDYAATCQKCGAKVPVYLGFRTWCECGWNITEPEGADRKPGVFTRTWAWLGKRRGEALYQEALRRGDAPPGPTLTGALSLLVALLVHLFTLALAGFGGWNLYATLAGWRGELLVVSLARLGLTAALWGMAWAVGPRLGNAPKKPLRRADAPALFRLLDRVAEALGAPPIQVVELTPEYNASIRQAGLRRETMLGLGVPLLLALDRQELVSTLGHEMAHHAHRDAAGGWFVGSAVGTLVAWHRLLWLEIDFENVNSFPMMMAQIGHIFLRLLSLLSYGLSVLLAILLYADMQRAEYRADAAEARVAGTAAAARGLYKCSLGENYFQVLKQAYHFPETDIRAELGRLADLPEREIQRLDRLQDMEQSRLDHSHPILRRRLGFLRARPSEAGLVALSPAEHQQILAELADGQAAVIADLRRAMPRPVAW